MEDVENKIKRSNNAKNSLNQTQTDGSNISDLISNLRQDLKKELNEMRREINNDNRDEYIKEVIREEVRAAIRTAKNFSTENEMDHEFAIDTQNGLSEPIPSRDINSRIVEVIRKGNDKIARKDNLILYNVDETDGNRTSEEMKIDEIFQNGIGENDCK